MELFNGPYFYSSIDVTHFEVIKSILFSPNARYCKFNCIGVRHKVYFFMKGLMPWVDGLFQFDAFFAVKNVELVLEYCLQKGCKVIAA